MQKKFTLEREQGVIMLSADGFQQICPFQQPTPTPVRSTILGGQPQLQFLPKVCSSLCPHFAFKEIEYNNKEGKEYLIELSCGHGTFIKIESEINEINRDGKGNVIEFKKQ